MHLRPPAEQITLDLVDVLIRENLFGFADRLTQTSAVSTDAGSDATRYEVPLRRGALRFEGRSNAALQAVRCTAAPVLAHAGEQTTVTDPADLLEMVAADGEVPALPEVLADLRLSVAHAERMQEGWHRLPSAELAENLLLTGERIASTRNRPFHPTAHAVSGWEAADLDRFGPMRREPLAVDWIAVQRLRLRHGSAPESVDLHTMLLNEAEGESLRAAMSAAGIDPREHQPIPIHPWHFENALERHFGAEMAAGVIVPVARGLGRFQPSSSLRTLLSCDDPHVHLKLPIEVATLGSTRLLPAQYLDNGERGQRLLRTLLDRSRTLAGLVDVCDERTWCGWNEADEFARRPGLLSAQVRRYPRPADDEILLPMSAFSAWSWNELSRIVGPAGYDPADPVGFFEDLVTLFWTIVLEFLSYGVMPELHGQNVLVALGRGRVRRFVLRDHDTVRIDPEALQRAGVPDPRYRIPEGVPQSLRLDDTAQLLGYAQTLGIQVNLFSIADSLADECGIPESTFWAVIDRALRELLSSAAVPANVVDIVRDRILEQPTWPSRQIFGPLLERGRSTEASMPASAGAVVNPLALAVLGE